MCGWVVKKIKDRGWRIESLDSRGRRIALWSLLSLHLAVLFDQLIQTHTRAFPTVLRAASSFIRSYDTNIIKCLWMVELDGGW